MSLSRERLMNDENNNHIDVLQIKSAKRQNAAEFSSM